jgi:multiple sugar transport system substrate-binding protein
MLCGCSDKSREEITFATWGSVTEVGITKKIISEFERNNPDIDVKFMHIPQNYFQKIHLLFASSTAPDVIFINNL